jgi:DNA-directed RNA polymerase specialized sigma24 family protein
MTASGKLCIIEEMFPPGQRGRLNRGRDLMSSRDTSLDYRLYAWLAEADDKRYWQAFDAYFRAAFPIVIRRLVRLSSWAACDVEDLAQEALLKFYSKIGRERPDLAHAVRRTLADIQPLALGSIHERHVGVWVGEVRNFIDKAMTFRIEATQSEEEWKSALASNLERIPVLQKEGWDLMRPVLTTLGWRDDVADFTSEVLSRSARAQDAEKILTGLCAFVGGSSYVIEHLPPLRIPTNAYLFEIVTTMYLDECKKRGRVKRGGTGTHRSELPARAERDIPAVMPSHPLDSMRDDEVQDLTELEPSRLNSRAPEVPQWGRITNDPTSEYEDTELYESFHEYLYHPVADAIEALQQAQLRGRASAEQRRYESVANKFSRAMSVLESLGEGYTQEETAERLGLSRNQVKYVVERVHEAYLQFEAEQFRQVAQGSQRGGLGLDR